MKVKVNLDIEPREGTGKGAAGRLRRTGRVPAVLYGFETEPTAVSVDAIELYHALNTDLGTNVLLTIVQDGETKLCVARDIQRHLVKGHVRHLDLVAVDKSATILVDIPVTLIDEPDDLDGVINQVMGSIPIQVPPLNIPEDIKVSVAGMTIGDVRRVEDIAAALPEGASYDVDVERTVVTINPPDVLAEPEDEVSLLLDGEEPDEAAAPAEGTSAE